eukprot:CAMPEP_0183717462 /NCGR_PEP_ID=MMETSP0737-20130205/11072_1 /TAXON_ID=385413 /ORGANISM="Thalassiosira miniscula, Strain CCMP1093" /LENGTH=784 /DNA_ID=CAMNT_0025946915 /DNA_START=185 /DNA_END=2539 /DNA_ORIENTATION=-
MTATRAMSVAILFAMTCMSSLSLAKASINQFNAPTQYHTIEPEKQPRWVMQEQRQLAGNNIPIQRPQQQLSSQQNQIIQRPQQRTLQDDTPLCSCAPRSFTITLDLLRNCFDDTVANNGGIRETDCSIQVGDPDVALDGIDEVALMGMLDGLGLNNNADEKEGRDVVGEGELLVEIDGDNQDQQQGAQQSNSGDDVMDTASKGSEDDSDSDSTIESKGLNELLVIRPMKPLPHPDPQAKPQSQSNETPNVDDILSNIPWLMSKETTQNISQKKVKKRQNNKRKKGENKNQNDRTLQTNPAEPVAITSVTFIEVANNGDVINVDDQYTNVEFITGSSFFFESISSQLATDLLLEDQLELIPATSVIFMIGRNAAGEEVRGRFVLRYTNGCESNENGIAVQEGDVLAWNTWTDVQDQFEVFCPANIDGPLPPTVFPVDSPGPTEAPTSESPTTRPTDEATQVPTFAPTNLPTEPTITEEPTNEPTMEVTPSITTEVTTSIPTPDVTPLPTIDVTPDPTTELPTFAPSFGDTLAPSSAKPTPVTTEFPTEPTFTDAPSTTNPTPVGSEFPTEPTVTDAPTSPAPNNEITVTPTLTSGGPTVMSLPLDISSEDYQGNILDYFESRSGKSGKNSKSRIRRSKSSKVSSSKSSKSSKSQKSRKSGKRSKSYSEGGSHYNDAVGSSDSTYSRDEEDTTMPEYTEYSSDAYSEGGQISKSGKATSPSKSSKSIITSLKEDGSSKSSKASHYGVSATVSSNDYNGNTSSSDAEYNSDSSLYSGSKSNKSGKTR